MNANNLHGAAAVAEPATGTRSGPAAPGTDVPFREETPRLGPWRERLLHVFATVTLCYSTYYLAWRWTSTLNPDALWISVPLAMAETLATLLLAFTVFNVWRLPVRQPPPAPPGLTVDVFITAYDEPVEVIRKTVIGAKAITYPHRTYILDDGRNIELARMARELGIGYITREDNRNAKAGNLNNALKQTSGEYILQLDADHVPLPYILDRMLGYMHEDPKLAFVQAPQNFYNNEAFGTHYNPQTGRLLTDQNIFFYLLQAGKDRLNATFFCGSCAVLRRSAIEEVGGFASKTITEDIETSLLLHARGWRSLYHNETLAYGLAPRTFEGFSVQRSRWARGGMQMLRHYNPLTLPGLTLKQRLSYLSANLHCLEGPIRLVFMIAPIVFLLTGVYSVRAYGPDFLAHFLPFVVLTLMLHQLVARGRSGPIWFLEVVATAKSFAHTGSLAALLTKRQLRFNVTPKGLENVAWKAHIPFVLLFFACLAALIHGGWVFTRDALRWGFTAADPLAYSLNLVWVGWNTVITGLVLRACVRSLQRRPMQRFDEFLPFRLRVTGASAGSACWLTALTENLHEDGLAFRSAHALPVGATVEIVLPLANDRVEATGRIVHRRPVRIGDAGFQCHGVRFDELPRSARDAISLHCTHAAVPGVRHLYVEEQDPFVDAIRRVRNQRRHRRERVLLPVRVEHGQERGGSTLAVLQDTSRGGARLLLERRPAPDSVLTYEVPGTTIQGGGRVIHVRRVPTPLGDRWAAGVLHAPASAGAVLIPRGPRLRLIEKTAMIAGVITTLKRFSIVLVAAVAFATAPPVHAQSVGALSGVEAAADGQSLFLVGGWVGATAGTVRPVAGFVAYRLAYDIAGGRTDIWTANPFVGLRRQWGATGAQVNVGWSFQSDVVTEGGRQNGSGLTTGFQLDRGGAVATTASALVSYAWGDEGYLWTRGRVATRVAGEDAPRLRLGLESTVQGGGGYSAFEIGPLFEWSPPGVATFVASAGWRHGDSDPGDPQNTTFFRAEIVVVP